MFSSLIGTKPLLPLFNIPQAQLHKKSGIFCELFLSSHFNGEEHYRNMPLAKCLFLLQKLSKDPPIRQTSAGRSYDTYSHWIKYKLIDGEEVIYESKNYETPSKASAKIEIFSEDPQLVPISSE